MADPVRDLVESMRTLIPDAKTPTALATVTAVDTSGVAVRFDGESVPSSRRYRTTANARVGDRVVMLRVASTWVCVGGAHMQGPLLPLQSLRATGNRLVSVSPGGLSVVHEAPIWAIPAGAVLAQVTVHGNGHAAANAACDWYPRVRYTVGSSYTAVSGNAVDVELGPFTTHNEANPTLGLSITATQTLDVRAHAAAGSRSLYLWTELYNHAGSGAGIHPGWGSYSCTFLGHS